MAMGHEDKIIGMYRPEDDTMAPDRRQAAVTADIMDMSPDDEFDYYDQEVDTVPARPAGMMIALVSVLALLLLVWTTAFIWVHQTAFNAVPVPSEILALIGEWATPAMFLAIVWLVALRSSRAESGRFANVARKLQSESRSLEERLRNVNAELSIARSFLAEQALALESLGRQSSENLSRHAASIADALSISEAKARVLDEVSNSATTNLEQLRKQLPVITNAAKDVTNQIGNTGRTAQEQVAALVKGLKSAYVTGSGVREQVAAFSQEIDQRIEAIGSAHVALTTDLNHRFQEAEHRANAVADSLTRTAGQLNAAVEKSHQAMAQGMDETADILGQHLTAIGSAMTTFSATSAAEQNRIRTLLDEVAVHSVRSREAVNQLADESALIDTKLRRLLETAQGETAQLRDSLADNSGSAETLGDKLTVLGDIVRHQQTQFSIVLPDALNRLEGQLVSLAARFDEQVPVLNAMAVNGERLADHVATVDRQLGDQATMLDEMLSHGDKGLEDQLRQIEAQQLQVETLAASLEQARKLAKVAAEESNAVLGDALARIDTATSDAAATARRRLGDVISTAVGELRQLSDESLRAVLAERIDKASQALNDAIGGALSASTDTTQLLEGRVSRLGEMTANLEARIAEAHQQFDGVGEDGFARRMALLTESLHSASIDIAKILSNDVTDTAWSAYLKGDRGIFTRRAVRLLDSSEVRLITEHYDSDSEFRTQVNRYIHDFESMMRNLLSTHDGHAISVTLLSSDVGKLYVALAQAIERLRA